MGKKIVVIGGVAAGPKAAARARRLDPSAEITIVEKDELLSYAGCGLPYYISGVVEDRRQLMETPIGVLRDPQFFAQVKNIQVLNRTKAVKIDREAKEVEVQRLDSGETQRLPYDKLIIATGAEPLEPPIPGRDLKNVLRLKRLEAESTAMKAMRMASSGVSLRAGEQWRPLWCFSASASGPMWNWPNRLGSSSALPAGST